MSTEYMLYKKEKWEAKERYYKYLEKLKSNIESAFSALSVPEDEDWEAQNKLEELKDKILFEVECAGEEFEHIRAFVTGYKRVTWYIPKREIRKKITKEGYILINEYQEVIDFDALYEEVLKDCVSIDGS